MAFAIVLNLVFRAGVRQTNSRKFAVEQNSETVKQFINECGRTWGARNDAIFRTSAVAEEVNEYLKGMENPAGSFELKISFNELAITLDFFWVKEHPTVRAAVSPDDAIDQMPLRIIRHYSDRLVMREDKQGQTRMTIEIDDN